MVKTIGSGGLIKPQFITPATGGARAADTIDMSYVPYRISNLMFRAAWDEKTSVQGGWGQPPYVSQTDYDSKLTNVEGCIRNDTETNLDEIHFGNFILNAGTYKLIVVYVKSPNAGIIEILHGNTSLGTWDTYNVAVLYNQVGTATYSPATRVTGNLRVRVNGKNASSSIYIIRISRIELFRTG